MKRMHWMSKPYVEGTLHPASAQLLHRLQLCMCYTLFHRMSGVKKLFQNIVIDHAFCTVL